MKEKKIQLRKFSNNDKYGEPILYNLIKQKEIVICKQLYSFLIKL